MHTNYVEQTHITWMPSAETSVPFVRRNLWVSTVGVCNDVRDREGTTTGKHTTTGGLDNGRRNAAAAASAVNGIRGVCDIRAATDEGCCCPFAAAATLRSPADASADGAAAATAAAAATVFAHAAVANQGATELGGINGVVRSVSATTGQRTLQHTTTGGRDNGRRNAAAAAASAVNGIRGVCGIRAATDAGRCCPFAAAAPAICTATTLRSPAVASAATTAAAARVFAHAAIANQGATELGGINGVVGSVSATTGQRTLFRCGHVSGIRTGMLEGATSSCANTVGLTEHLGVGRWF